MIREDENIVSHHDCRRNHVPEANVVVTSTLQEADSMPNEGNLWRDVRGLFGTGFATNDLIK